MRRKQRSFASTLRLHDVDCARRYKGYHLVLVVKVLFINKIAKDLLLVLLRGNG